MRAFIGFASVVLLLGILVGGFLMVVSPTELVRNELVRQVKANTGRDLLIRGEASFRLYPKIGVSLEDVLLSTPPGMTGPPLLRADRIDLSVALMPLLNQEVLVEHVGLFRPVIDLRVDKDGRQSWQFAARTQPARVAHLGAAAGTMSDVAPSNSTLHLAAAVPASLGFLDKLELRSIAITKGTVNYSDALTGTGETVRDLDIRLTGRRIADPVSVRGGLVWQDERVDFTATVDTVSALLAKRAAKARITLNGRPLEAGFDGTIKVLPALEMIGQTRMSGPSVATTSGWLGFSLPNAGPLGGFSASGRLVASEASVALNGAALALGPTRANGTVSVALRGKRPRISANMRISELDVDRLTTAFSEGRAVARSRAPVRNSTRSRAGGGKGPQSIEDLLRRSQAEGAGRFSAPRVRGYEQRNAWNTDPINAAALGAVDANARLTIEGLKVSGLAIGRTVMRVALTNRNARIDLDDMVLYGGRGKGIITARPSGRGIGIGANVTVDNVAARPLLKDAAQFDRLAGVGNLRAAISGAGTSQKQIASSLKGKANFTFRDGAIVGWNVPQMIRGVRQGRLSNFEASPTSQTDFSEFAASFQINGGRAQTRDMRMTSPLLRLTGTGAVNIGGRSLDMMMRPRVVSSLDGQGGRNDLAGLEIPVRVHGPWENPQFTPDIGGVLKDPNKIVDTAKKLGQQLKGRNVGDVVRGVLGNGEKDAQGRGTSDRVKDLLGQFLR